MLSMSLVVAGLLSALGIVLITIKFSRKLLYAILGYDYLFDIALTTGFMAFMAGTYSGAMVAIISGICVSIILWITKNILGYSKYKNKEWVYYPGTWSMEYAGKQSRTLLDNLAVYILAFIKGWKK